MTTSYRKATVKLVNGKVTTTSLQIADTFGKEHYRVLRAIDNLECSAKFRAANFGLTEYIDSSGRKKNPAYTLTKDGFMFLVMGFTGKDAADWKERFIEAFNQLERRVNTIAAKKSVQALAAHKYHYPRKLLEQPGFAVEGAPAPLSIAMLGNTRRYASPLMALLNELRADGHDVEAALEEAIAMREAIQHANFALEEISVLALKGMYRPASNALRSKK